MKASNYKPVIPPGFIELDRNAQDHALENRFEVWNTYYHDGEDWVPFDGTSFRLPMIGPDSSVHKSAEHTPLINHHGMEDLDDVEVFVDASNEHVKGIHVWVPVERLTEYGKCLVDTFPMRVPVERDTDD